MFLSFGVLFLIFLERANLGYTLCDLHSFRIAKSYQKILRKWMQAKHDVHFLHECKSFNVYPKFERWKNIKNKTSKERNNYYNNNLNSAINKIRQELKTLTGKHSSILKNLNDSATWMKETLVIYSIKQQQNKLCRKTKERH